MEVIGKVTNMCMPFLVLESKIVGLWKDKFDQDLFIQLRICLKAALFFSPL